MEERPNRKHKQADKSRATSRVVRVRRPPGRANDRSTSGNVFWLTASEVGSFAFCPQSWYLDRCRVPVSDAAEARRETGRRNHREIGRQTDLVRAADAARWLLALAILATLLLLVVLVLRSAG